MSRLFADGSTSRESGRELGESRLHTTWVDLTPAPSTMLVSTDVVTAAWLVSMPQGTTPMPLIAEWPKMPR